MEISEILDGPAILGQSVVARGRVNSSTGGLNTPPTGGLHTTTIEQSVTTTTNPGEAQNYTLFKLIEAITDRTTARSAGQGPTGSSPVTGRGATPVSSSTVGGVILDMVNSTLQAVSAAVTETAQYDPLTTGAGLPGYNFTTTTAIISPSPGVSMWSTTTGDLGGVVGVSPTNLTIINPMGGADGVDVSMVAMETARAELLRVSLWQWMSPFIFLLGFIGNVAILIVLATRPVMSDNTTSTYVRCLAIADLLTLITGIIPEWMAFSNIFNFEEVHPVSCKFYKFFAYTASDASIWILAAFSVERFIAVVFPFKRQKGWCKVSQVKIVCVGLVLLGVTKNLQSFWTRGSEYKDGANGTLILRSNCGYPTDSDRYFNLYVRPWLVLISINIVPMIILWFCNFSVIWTFSRRQTIQRLQLHISSANKRANALTQQVTIMCLCASFSFIIFMTPSFILFIGKAYWAYSPTSRGPYLIAKAINNQLMYINNSINFYLYLFSGERFRNSVISIFIKCQWRKAMSDARSLSMRPPSSVAVSRLTSRGRRDPYEVALVSSNGVRLMKAGPDNTPCSSASATPLGSKESLHV